MKKAQITLFILMGVVILVAVGFVFYLNSLETRKDVEEPIEIPDEILPLKTFVDACIKKSVKESIYSISEGGWYYFSEDFLLLDILYGNSSSEVPPSPEDYLSTYAGDIPYHYNKGVSKIPSKEEVEHQFSEYIKDSLFFCTDFSMFEEIGYLIEKKDISVKSELSNNKLFVNVNYPLKIIKDEKITEINEFIYSHEYNYDKIDDSVQQLVNAVVEEPYYLDLTLLLEQYYGVSVIEYDTCNDIYIIVDNESMSKDKDSDVIFRFAVRFSDELCKLVKKEPSKEPIPAPTPRENQAPILEPVSYQSVAVNETIIIKMKATDPENDAIFYLSSGILKNFTFPLDGIILFIPQESHRGFHTINVTAVDIHGNHDTEFFNLEVI